MSPTRKAEKDGDTYRVTERYSVGPTLRAHEAVERVEFSKGRAHSIDGHEYFIEEEGDDPCRVSKSYDWLKYIHGKRTITLLSSK